MKRWYQHALVLQSAITIIEFRHGKISSWRTSYRLISSYWEKFMNSSEEDQGYIIDHNASIAQHVKFPAQTQHEVS